LRHAKIFHYPNQVIKKKHTATLNIHLIIKIKKCEIVFSKQFNGLIAENQSRTMENAAVQSEEPPANEIHVANVSIN
jgi:hypothetical protein